MDMAGALVLATSVMGLGAITFSALTSRFSGATAERA